MPNATTIVLALLGLALLLLPHHYDSTGHAKNLAGELIDALSSGGSGTGPVWILVVIVAALAAVAPLAPAALAVVIGLTDPPSSTRLTLGLGSAALLILALLCGFLIYISDVSFGFGGGVHTGRPTIWAFMIPAYIATLGLLAASAAAIPDLATFLHRSIA